MSSPAPSAPPPLPAAAAVSDADLPLPCPNCGYDLRATTSRRCPECGIELDEEVFSTRAAIPWQERRRIGRFRAFIRTVLFAMRRTGQLARQAGREVDYPSARRFQLICCIIAWCCIVPVCIPVWSELGISFDSYSYLAGIADASIVIALAAGLFLWLLTATGLPSYFFHPRSLPVVLQDRAIALSYYSAAPLALTPLAVGASALVAVVFEASWPADLPMLVTGAALTVAGSLWLLILADMVWMPLTLLAKGIHATPGRMFLCLIVLALGWPILFVIFVAGLPFLVIYVQVAWHTLQ